MARLARALCDDQPLPSRSIGGAVRLLARAANDDTPYANPTSTTEGAAAIGSNPALSLTMTFTAAETTTTAFDPNGNKTRVSALNGTFGAAPLSVTQMSYDGVGRMICTAARENAAAFTALPDACTQSAGGAYGPDPITKAAYDLAGQALSETRGYGTPLAQAYATFTWGHDGETLSVMDANSNTIHLGYDGFNRLNKITHPDATVETSVYDPDGDLVIWTNRGGYGVVRCGACPRAGQRPDPGDVLNRKISESGITGASLSGGCATGGTTNLTTRSWDIQPRTFTYDLAGRLAGASIPNYPLSWSYDAAGRLTAHGTWYTSYGWDNAGNLQTLNYPDGTTSVTYQYDPLNRTTKALIGTTSYGTLTYDSLGRRQKLTFLGGTSQTWNYDNADRVTSIVHVFPNETVDNVTFSYGYDPSGRDASKTLDNSAYAYVPTAASTSYAAANALNQYPSVGGYTYSWWPAGELNQTDTFQANYDEFGKLMLANITATPGTIDLNDAEFMGEDALDHIYFHGRQTTAGDNHPFIYHDTDGLRPETIFETLCLQTGSGVPTCTGAGTGTRLYVLGPDPDERWAYIGSSGGIYEPHTDREGTLIALAQGGNAAQIYTWDAYGQNSAPSNDNGTGPPGYLYRYTGQRFDPNTSLYDYKARTYSPGLGRFLQPDPKGLDQGPNLYGYAANNPLGAQDPTGMDCDPMLECQTTFGPAHGAPSGGSSEQAGTTQGGQSSGGDALGAPVSRPTGGVLLKTGGGGEDEEDERDPFGLDPAAEVWEARYAEALKSLRQLDPNASFIGPPGPADRTSMRVVEGQLAAEREIWTTRIVSHAFRDQGHGPEFGIARADTFGYLALQTMSRNTGMPATVGGPNRVFFYDPSTQALVIINRSFPEESTMYRASQTYVNNYTK